MVLGYFGRYLKAVDDRYLSLYISVHMISKCKKKLLILIYDPLKCLNSLFKNACPRIYVQIVLELNETCSLLQQIEFAL